MAAPSLRPLAPIGGLEQWLLCGHTDTAVDLDDEVVTLAWQARDDGVDWDGAAAPEPAGLTFAANGCLYHGVPERAQIERVAWPREQSTVDLLPAPDGGDSGGVTGFRPVEPLPGLSLRAVALAADSDEHLFVLDGPTGLVHVLDLVDGHLLRTVALPWAPVDLAATGDTVLIATADLAHPLVSMTALSLPAEVPVPAGTFSDLPVGTIPRRVAAGRVDGRWGRWLLVGDAAGAIFAVPLGSDGPALPIEVVGATDIEVDGVGALVVAGPPGADLRRFVVTALAIGEDAPLRARGYDGRGLVRTPDGRIGYWTGRGFRTALEARRRFSTSGHVDAFALDSGAYRTQWGRVFVEACVPPGARIRIGFATSDDAPAWDEPIGPSITGGAPQMVEVGPGSGGGAAGVLRPLVPTGLEPVVAQPWPMHRREVGPDRPWARRAPGDRFEVYEAPVQAPPGRYLWVRVTLEGNTRVTPRLRAVRVEVSSHDLLDRLPALYRRDEQTASFLRRYLALADGLLGEVEARAVQRDLVLEPFGAPPELLPWLASLVGLVLDERWSEHARRTMLAEAICLFRWRGTIAGLRRMIGIYLESDVVIVEAFRFRGTGGAFADGGSQPEGTANAVVGYGYRVGGEVGQATAQPLSGTTADAYRTHAHRFSVIVPRDLDDEQLETLAHLLDLHRPAHTLVDVCPAGRGMRIGAGLHVEVSSVVGPSAGFRPSVVGASRIGPPTVLGRLRAGVRAGGARLGQSTVVDP
jgi:phage tail-like protein